MAEFFVKAISVQASEAEERTVRLVEHQANLRKQLLEERVSSTVMRLMELLFSDPYVSTSFVSKALQVSSPTAQSAVDRLVQRGDLVESTGRKRGRFYFAPGIFEAVYGTDELPSANETTLD